MTEVLIEIARARRIAALDAVEKRRDNVFNIGAGRQRSRPLFISARAA